MFPVHVSLALSSLDVYIKDYNLSLRPRLRVPVSPCCVHRDNAIVCNYKVNGCFWSKVNFSFIRLLPLFGRVMLLLVVNSRGGASKPGCF